MLRRSTRCAVWRQVRGRWDLPLAVLALVVGWGGEAIAGMEHAPVTQLPPGLVILAQPKTPQGVVKLGLHRIRFLGKVRLVLNEADQPGFPGGGPATYATYPIRAGNQGDGDVNGPVFMGPVIGGECRVRKFLLVAAVVLRPGVIAWIRADSVVRRMRTAAVPSAFGVAGPLIYAVVHGWPSMTIELRDASGTEISHVRVAGSGICST